MRREILNAIFYILRGGVPWRMLPAGFPPWKTVFHYFRQWRLSGLWEAINANGDVAGPWVAEIFASQQQCLRLDVTQENVNTEIVAVSPSGLVFRNDDRSAADQRPLVKVNGTERGFYTVQVSTSAGDAVESDFVLAFGRYNLNNPNCAQPTQPAAAEVAGPAAQGGSLGPNVTGGPSDGH